MGDIIRVPQEHKLNLQDLGTRLNQDPKLQKFGDVGSSIYLLWREKGVPDSRQLEILIFGSHLKGKKDGFFSPIVQRTL